MLRNYDKIRTCLFSDLSKRHYEKYVTHLVKNCGIITLQKSQIDEYLDKNFIEMDGIKYDYPTE